MLKMHTLSGGLVLGAVLAFGGSALAEEMKFRAELTGAAQVPPVTTDATGTVEVTYDTVAKNLTWTLEYEGLSGEATAAHFHGPADEGETAPPVIPASELASGSEESAEITADQVQLLMDGKLYFNVHTAANPGGEIRGQVVAANAN